MRFILFILPLAAMTMACSSPSSLVRPDSNTPDEDLARIYSTKKELVLCAIDGVQGGRKVLNKKMPCKNGWIWNSFWDGGIDVKLEPGPHVLSVGYFSIVTSGNLVYTYASDGSSDTKFTAEKGKTYDLVKPTIYAKIEVVEVKK